MISKLKSRYILVEASKPISLDARGAEELNSRLIEVLGELQFAHTNPKIIRQYDEKTFSIKAARSTEGQLILSLAFITSFGSGPIRFYTLRTSGTLRALSKAMRKTD